MKKEIMLIGFLLVLLLIGGVVATEVFDVGLKVEDKEDEGFLQNTQEFLFRWLVEGDDINSEEKSENSESQVNVKENFEEDIMGERIGFENVKKTFELLNLLSGNVQDLALEFVGWKFGVLY